MELVVFVGLQGSGKSTFYRQRFASSHVHVSKDNFPSARSRDRRQMALLREALELGHSVVVDNTNPTAEERARLISLGRATGSRIVGYYFESRIGDALERNRSREGKARVPDVAIFATAKKLERPSYAEGFDELFQVCLDPSGGFTLAAWHSQPG